MTLFTGALMGINFATGFLDGVKQSNAYRQSAYDYRQQAAAFRRNAYLTRLSGALNEDVSRAKNRAYLSNATASAAEIGMNESPTFISALSSSAAALEQNVLNDRYYTESKAENYLYQARVADANARMLKKRSRHAFQNGLISGIGSAFGVYSLY